jgi:S1-C subfamily serine protease
VNTPAQLIALVKSLSPDDWATFSIRRGDRTMDIKAFLQERPDNAGQLHMLEGYVGAEGIDLTPELREHFGAPREAGVMISRIAEGSPAEIAGLLVGDVVFEVDGEPMRSGGMLRAALDGGGVDNRVEVRLVRDGAKITIEPLVVVRPDREDRADD